MIALCIICLVALVALCVIDIREKRLDFLRGSAPNSRNIDPR